MFGNNNQQPTSDPEFGQRAFLYAMFTLGLWVVAIIGSWTGIEILRYIGYASIALGVLAFITGNKELAADSSNKKAKIGKWIGLIFVLLQLLGAVVVIAFYSFMV